LRAPVDQLSPVSYLARVRDGSRVTIEIGEQAMDLLGYTPDHFRQDPFLWRDTLLHPDDRDRVLAAAERALASGEPTTSEYRLVARDGQSVWVSDVMVPLDADTGAVERRLQGFIVDVTARKDLEQLHGAVIDTSLALIVVLDLDGRIRIASPSHQTLLGVSPAELQGTIASALVHPEDVSQLQERRAALGRGEPGTLVTFRVRRVDGEYIWVESSAQLAHDANGEPVVVGVSRDITAELRSERERSEAEARYRRLAEQLPLVTYIDEPDEDTTPRYVSAAIEGILGYTPEEWVSDPQLWFEGIHPEDRLWVEPRVRDAYRRFEPHVELEYRFFRRDGRMVWLRDEAVLAVDDDGNPLYYQGFMLDLTERRELEERYLQAQRLEAVGRLAGGIAHDFNNILTAIGGYAAFLCERLGCDTDLGRDAAEIVDAAARAEQLTRQLLAFGRRQVLQPRPISMNGVVGGIQRLLSRAAGDGIELVFDLAEHDPWTFADAGQVEQVLLNLVVNARDAMPSGGTLRIASGRRMVREGELANAVPGSYAELSISDTGVGMSEEVLANIFEPFFTTKDEAAGSGLGLATVFGIVTQSGGYVDVDSTQGVGTTVRVLLPLERPAQHEPEPARPQDQLRSGGGERVLLVEDDPRVRELTRRMLERCGYGVITAEDGAEALACPDLASVDVVVTDIVMPGMGGRELAERLAVTCPGLPVLLVSGHAADQLELGGNLPPGTVFLAKPFTLHELASLVGSLLQSKAA
jgi:PAS domain S-box-containing protein